MEDAIKGLQSYIDRFNKMIATSIEHILQTTSKTKNIIYNLSGHRIDNNQTIKSGIYIINGKKKILK